MAYPSSNKVPNRKAKKAQILAKVQEHSTQKNNRFQSLVHLSDSVFHNAKHGLGHLKETIKNYKDMRAHMKKMPEFQKHLDQMKLS